MKTNRHRAEVIEVEPGGAAVRFTNGRIEWVTNQGLTVGQRGMASYTQTIGGFMWTFDLNKSQEK